MDWIGVTGALWGIRTMQWRSKAELCFLCTQIQKYKYTNLYLKTEAHMDGGTAVPCRVQRRCCPGALHHALCTMLVSSCYAEARYLFSVKCHKSFSFTRLPQHIPPSYFKSGRNTFGCFSLLYHHTFLSYWSNAPLDYGWTRPSRASTHCASDNCPIVQIFLHSCLVMMMTTSSVMMMTMTTVMIRLHLAQVWWWLQHLLYDDDDIDDHQSEVGTGVAGGPSVNKFHEVSLPTSHPYNCRHYHRHQHHHCHPGHRQHHHHHYCHHHRDPHRPHLYVLPLSFNRGQDCRVHLEHYLDVKKLCPYDRKHWQTQPNLAMHTPHTAQDKSDKDANKSKRSADIFLQIVIRGETSHGQWRCRGQ